MKKLFVYLRDYRRECVLGPLFKLLEALLELFVPLVMAAIIDRGIAVGDRGFITRMGALLVGLGVVGLASSLTAQYFAAKAAVGFAAKLRRALFGRVQALSFGTYDTLGRATLITRMTSDVNQVQTAVNLALRLLLRSPFIVFGAMIMAFTIDTRAALIFVGAIALLSAVVFAILLWSIPRYRKLQTRLDEVLHAVRENLEGTRVLRAFNRQEAEIGEFGRKNGAFTGYGLYVGRVSALMNPLTYVLVNLALALLLKTGAVRVNAGALTQGQLVALVNYLSQILAELVKMANLILTITRGWACGDRIASLLDTPLPDVGSESANPSESVPAVEFRGVSLTYPGGGADALSDISFTVRRGETFGIIGGTGSGKSSVVSLIPGFYPATGGSVLVDGLDAQRWAPDALRARIGLVPQKSLLFSGTLRENLLWGRPDATDDELRRALELAQAWEFVEKLPKGLDSPIEQGGRNLSGGQRQRLGIARALVRRPEILILDDSASALDYATDARLRAALRTLSDTTVFIVSQRTASLRAADRILVLDDGRAVGLGRHDELLESCAVYREIYDSQFKREEA